MGSLSAADIMAFFEGAAGLMVEADDTALPPEFLDDNVDAAAAPAAAPNAQPTPPTAAPDTAASAPAAAPDAEVVPSTPAAFVAVAKRGA